MTIKYDPSQKSVPMDIWVEERHQNYIATKFRCKSVLFSDKSEYQYIDVINTVGFGRMLLNDSIVMFSERDEFIYHEMMAHVCLFTHPNPKKVLIIGGGDGGVAREVLRHPNITECTVVEIDKMVVEVSKKYFPKIACSFQNPKLKLKIQDGVEFVKNSNQKFDIILIDSTDPFGPAKDLFSTEFYQNVSQLLSTDGILVVQAESVFYDSDAQKYILKSLKKTFPINLLYNYHNMVYPSGLWSFALASKKYHPLKDFQVQKFKQSNWNYSYYNKDIHKAAFVQSEYIKKTLKNFVSDL